MAVLSVKELFFLGESVFFFKVSQSFCSSLNCLRYSPFNNFHHIRLFMLKLSSVWRHNEWFEKS